MTALTTLTVTAVTLHDSHTVSLSPLVHVIVIVLFFSVIMLLQSDVVGTIISL